MTVMSKGHRILIVIALSLITYHLSFSPARAQGADTIRTFTQEHPLVYEDAWDLWPYAFLNENGEAVGYNIDLLKMLCKELNIPYVIKLKPTQDALNDLRSGHADLMCGMDAHFHNDYGHYGKTVIQIFTHSVLHQKTDPVKIKTLEDLGRHHVIVHKGSFSHHLMIKHGWDDNAIAYDDMQDAVQKAHLSKEYQIVWNTMSLDYLIRKFNYDDLELVPAWRIQVYVEPSAPAEPVGQRLRNTQRGRTPATHSEQMVLPRPNRYGHPPLDMEGGWHTAAVGRRHTRLLRGLSFP